MYHYWIPNYISITQRTNLTIKETVGYPLVVFIVSLRAYAFAFL